MFFEHIQGTRHESNARCEKSLSLQMAQMTHKHHIQESYEIAGTLVPRSATQCSEDLFQSTTRGTIVYHSHTTTLGRCATAEFYHIGHTKYENAITEGGHVPGGYNLNRGPQAMYFTHLHQPAGQDLKPCHDAIDVVDMERAQEERRTSSSSRLSTVASSASTRFTKNASKSVKYLPDEAETYTNSRVAVA